MLYSVQRGGVAIVSSLYGPLRDDIREKTRRDDGVDAVVMPLPAMVGQSTDGKRTQYCGEEVLACKTGCMAPSETTIPNPVMMVA